MTKQAVSQDIAPPPELHQHHVVRKVAADDAGRFRHVVADGTRLQRYRAGDLIDQRQMEAGEVLYSDWFHGNPPTSVTGSYDVPVDGGGGTPEGSEHSRQMCREAIHAVGIRLAAPVAHVAIFDGCIFGWARTRMVPIETAKEALRCGLDRLADHYRL